MVGFLDDMWIMISIDEDDSSKRVLNIQSQIRIGTCDYEKNYEHVEEMINCIYSNSN